jgi:aspartate carbamoyltransferase catalytic subunit
MGLSRGSLRGRDLISMNDLSREEIYTVLKVAKDFKLASLLMASFKLQRSASSILSHLICYLATITLNLF